MANLKEFTKQVRKDVIEMVHTAKSGHIGGSLSSVDILAVLYNKILNIPRAWSDSPDFAQRDRFILSKGHITPAFYATLARAGFFDPELLKTFRKLGSLLQGHPCLHTKLAGIEISTGSLGQGLSIGVGVAKGLKLDGSKSKVYVLMGDGEIQEGSVWEAFMSAPCGKLDNIVAIIDKNNLQIDGKVADIKCVDPLDKKLEAFGWNVLVVDGHNLDELELAFNKAKEAHTPTAVICNTIKGKGVSFMENNHAWHGKAPNDEQYNLAMEELNAN